MEICQENNFLIKLEQLVKQFAPYQKVTLVYDFSLCFDTLNEIETALNKNCILTKFIFSNEFDFSTLNYNLQDCSRLLILACDADSSLKIKSNIASTKIPLIQIQTSPSLLGYFLDENCKISLCENEFLLMKKDEYVHDEQGDFVYALSSICFLLSHSISSKIEAYNSNNAELCTRSQNALEYLIKNIKLIFEIVNIEQQNNKIIETQINYLKNANSEIIFEEKMFCIKNDLNYLQSIDACFVYLYSSLFVMQCFNQNNIKLVDAYKLANKYDSSFYIDCSKKYYDLIFSSNYFATLKEYYLSFGYDIQRILNEFNYIKKYINLKKNHKKSQKNDKNIVFLLKKIKHFEIINLNINFYSIPILLNIYEKIAD